jgi:hypothetical protein
MGVNGARAGVPHSAALTDPCCPAQMTCTTREDSRPQSAVTAASFTDGIALTTPTEPVTPDVHAAPQITGATSSPAARYVLFRAFRI